VSYNPLHMGDGTDPEIYRSDEFKLKIDPLRMNPGEGFNLRLVVDGGRTGNVTLGATLFEQTAPPRREEGTVEDPTGGALMVGLLGLLGLTLAFGLGGTAIDRVTREPSPSLLGSAVLGLLAMGGVVVGAYFVRIFWRLWRARRIYRALAPARTMKTTARD
jgi:hypothetical protein